MSNSAIKQKTGSCIDCGPGTAHKPLTAKRCHFHYWKYRNKVKADERKEKGLFVDADMSAQQKALALWFKSQIDKMPPRCENCGDRLFMFAPWAAKAFIAHILPKKTFVSVRTHPDNRLYLCVICHTNYDKWGADKVRQMPVFELAVERLTLFLNDIAPNELNSLPKAFISHECIA